MMLPSIAGAICLAFLLAILAIALVLANRRAKERDERDIRTDFD